MSFECESGVLLSHKEGNLVMKKLSHFVKQTFSRPTHLIEVVRTFDENNLKVVKLRLQAGGKDFTTESIEMVSDGIMKRKPRFGPLILAQLKAKRGNLGIWQSGFNYNADPIKLQTPQPSLPGAFMRKNQLLPQISYWVTSFGKIHRPGCSFYERGRGTLMAKPSGIDCRICGGRKGKR